METLKIEKEEEFELEDEIKEEIKPSLEYEKLLSEERDRADNEKARNLVKFGCFNQKQESKLDFTKFQKIAQKKKFKGVYDLYRNLDTMELTFIAPLVEQKENANKMAPYAYDVITLEYMDNETYEAVCHAAKNNISSFVSVLYKATYISYCVFALFSVFIFLYKWIGENFSTALLLGGPLLGFTVLALPILVLMTIKYKKYLEK